MTKSFQKINPIGFETYRVCNKYLRLLIQLPHGLNMNLV